MYHINTHNLTMEVSKEAKWFKEMRPVAENVTGMVAGIVAGYGSAATGPLAPFVSLGAGEGVKTATHMLLKEMEKHVINNPDVHESVDRGENGYAYAKGVLRKHWYNKSAGLGASFLTLLWDNPSSSFTNHIITIKAKLVYDIVKEDYEHGQYSGSEWECKEKSIETYVTIHIVADDESGVGEPKSSGQYALTGSYSYGQMSFSDLQKYITGGLSNVKDSTAGSPVIGNMGWMMYLTQHPTQYQLQEAGYKYYEGIITGTDSEDYYQFTFDPKVVPHSDLYDAYQIMVYLIAGRGAPMMMDIHYRGIDYSGYTTKGKGMTSFEIWTPAWKSGQTQGKVIKIRVHPDVVMGTENGNKIYITSEGIYLLYCSVVGYKDVGNYQPYVHITGKTTYGNHATISFHIEDKKDGDWDNGLIYKYTVYWGDGTHTSVTHVDRTSKDVTIDHLYQYGGTYNVKVEVEDYYSYSYGDSIDREGISVSVIGGGGGGCPFLYTYNGGWRERTMCWYGQRMPRDHF